jgi:hypothetical protein
MSAWEITISVIGDSDKPPNIRPALPFGLGLLTSERRRRADRGKLLDSNQDLIQLAKRVHPRTPIFFKPCFGLKFPDGTFGGPVIGADFKTVLVGFVGAVEEKASPRSPLAAEVATAVFWRRNAPFSGAESSYAARVGHRERAISARRAVVAGSQSCGLLHPLRDGDGWLGYRSFRGAREWECCARASASWGRRRSNSNQIGYWCFFSVVVRLGCSPQIGLVLLRQIDPA